MYFHDRAEAGRKLADELLAYRYEDSIVLALSPGGVVVGEQIARRLHCGLTLLLTSRITAPGDDSLVIGTIDQTGGFSYNSMISTGEMEEYMQDMRGYVEEERLHRIYEMTTVLGGHGAIDPDQLTDRNIIIATDGVKNGMSFDAAAYFLKYSHVKKLIGAVPVGPAEVIERLSSMLDEMHYLYIPESFFSVGHYYIDEPGIDPASVISRINNIESNWV